MFPDFRASGFQIVSLPDINMDEINKVNVRPEEANMSSSEPWKRSQLWGIERGQGLRIVLRVEWTRWWLEFKLVHV